MLSSWSCVLFLAKPSNRSEKYHSIIVMRSIDLRITHLHTSLQSPFKLLTQFFFGRLQSLPFTSRQNSSILRRVNSLQCQCYPTSHTMNIIHFHGMFIYHFMSHHIKRHRKFTNLANIKIH